MGQLNVCGLVCCGSQPFDSKYIQHKLLYICSVIISFVVIIVLAAGKPLKYDPNFKGPIRGKSRFVVVTCFMHQVVNLELHYNKQTVKSKHIEIEYIYA